MRTRALSAAVLLLVATTACSDDGAGTPASIITSATLERHPTNAISAILHVETASASSISATVDGPGGSFDIPADRPAKEHTIPVVGMRAESEYAVTVHAEPEGGGTPAERVLDITTGALPADLPPITVAEANTDAMAPGYTVFNAMPWAPVPEGQPAPDAGYIIAVDQTGAVVWYDRTNLGILDVDTTARGTFIVTAGDAVIKEIDLLGDVRREWGSRVATEDPGADLDGRPLSSDATKPIAIDSTHHEVTELPDGHLLTLSTELIELSPAEAELLCPGDPEASVVGDVVVELDGDGNVVQEWPISAVYAPTSTPGSEMCINGPAIAPPNWFYPSANRTRDWTHANAIALDVESNTLLVSSRHLNQVLGLRYHDDGDGKAGELLWSLGVDGTIDLIGEPPYHQHAVELSGGDTMLLYDNGNMRPGTVLAGGSAPAFSRAVRYEIDRERGTARQVWEHRDSWPDGTPIFTAFLGDVDLVPNGNVLITHGAASTAALGPLQGRVLEVVPGDAADGSQDTTVFDITIGDGTSPGGWTLYRAERLPSLYFATSR